MNELPTRNQIDIQFMIWAVKAYRDKIPYTEVEKACIRRGITALELGEEIETKIKTAIRESLDA